MQRSKNMNTEIVNIAFGGLFYNPTINVITPFFIKKTDDY